MSKKSSSNSEKFFQENLEKIIIILVVIFVFGIIVGNNISNLTKTKGSIFDWFSKSSSSNLLASSSWANASWSSASWSSASWASTSSSSSSSAIAANDNVLYLEKAALVTKETDAGQKIYFDLKTTGAYLNSASITLQDKDKNLKFTSSLVRNSMGDFVTVPMDVIEGNYKITDILLVGLNSDGTTFTKQYSESATGKDINKYNFDGTVLVKNTIATSKVTDNSGNIISKINLKGLSLKTNKAKTGSKVAVIYDADQKLTKLKLKFVSSNNDEFIVFVQSLENNPYFEIPSTVSKGVYQLTMATLTKNSLTTMYGSENIQGINNYKFDVTLEVENGKQSYVYNSDQLNEKVITDIYKSANGITVKINADSNPIINSELFNVLKRKNKNVIFNYDNNEMIFNGRDIKEAKTIDVSMKSSVINSNSELFNYIGRGVSIEFASNGNLPGEASVRIKATDEMKNVLNESVYVYYYNSDQKKFEYIDKIKRTQNDGYYEFNITHTSQYVLTNEKIASELINTVSTDGNKIIQNNNSLKILLGICLLSIITVIVILIIEKRKKKLIK